MAPLDRPPVILALQANGQPPTTAVSVRTTVEEASGAVYAGATATTDASGVARFPSLSIGVGAAGFPGSSTVVRLRFSASGFSDVVSDPVQLTCFQMSAPLDRVFSYSSSLRQGDCRYFGNYIKSFVFQQPDSGGDFGDAVDLLVQLTADVWDAQYPGIVLRGAETLEDEQVPVTMGVSVASGSALRTRVVIGPGAMHIGAFGSPSTLPAIGFVLATSVQSVDQPNTCDDFVVIPIQRDLQFQQSITSTDCRITSAFGYTDRYVAWLPPGTSVRDRGGRWWCRAHQWRLAVSHRSQKSELQWAGAGCVGNGQREQFHVYRDEHRRELPYVHAFGGRHQSRDGESLSPQGFVFEAPMKALSIDEHSGRNGQSFLSASHLRMGPVHRTRLRRNRPLGYVSRSLTAVCIMLVSAACSEGGSSGPEPITSVTVSPSTVSLKTGETAVLTATAMGAAGQILSDGRPVNWTSSSVAVATVSNGTVTATGPGTASIMATIEGRSASAQVTVVPPVASVLVEPFDGDVECRWHTTLVASTRDAAGAVRPTAPELDVIESGDATVNATGVVTAVASGTVTITAASEGRRGRLS